jgi:hypothetical protein
MNSFRVDPSKERMRRSIRRRLAGVTALVLALGAAPAVLAGSASEPSPDLGSAATGSTSRGAILDHLTDGWSAVRLGFGVTPLRTQFGPAVAAIPGAHGGEGDRPLDADSRGTAVSFDLKLGWPGAARMGPLEPYLVLGPALFVIEPDYAHRLLGTGVDPTLQLGAKAGAGVHWRLGKHATLFGAYEVTTTAQGGLASPGAKTPVDTGISGYDLTYGLRFLY